MKSDPTGLRVRRVKSEEDVAHLGTKPLCNATIAKHCLTWLFLDFGSMQDWKDSKVRDRRQDSQLAVH